MGCRGDVEIKYSDGNNIFLYTHSEADVLLSKVQTALAAHKDRWGDESYLSRYIFSEMIGDESMLHSDYGLGISPYPMGDEESVVVDLDNKTITVVDCEYGEWFKKENRIEIRDMPFEEFIQLNLNEDYYNSDT